MTHTHEYAVLASHRRFTGAIFDVVTDELVMPGGVRASRDYTRHVGAVGVVALDEQDRVVLVRQYRHPVRAVLWELPAGLVDVPGEPPEQTAARELAEEADLVAGRWQHLLDLHTSPGFTDELIKIFLARELTSVPPHALHQREHEEAELTVTRVPLDEAVAMALRAEITNGPCVAGVLAAARVRDRGFAGL